MKINKNQYIGKRLTWDEAVNIFPDMWVAFRDCEMSGIDIENGILVDVIMDKDIKAYRIQHFNENIIIDRTTENCTMGNIHVEIKEKTYENVQ